MRLFVCLAVFCNYTLDLGDAAYVAANYRTYLPILLLAVICIDSVLDIVQATETILQHKGTILCGKW